MTVPLTPSRRFVLFAACVLAALSTSCAEDLAANRDAAHSADRAGDTAQGEATARAAIGDWPQWRGPNRDGIAPETAINLDWRDREPQVLWTVLLGAGFSSIAVGDGKLYTMAADKDSEFVICLDARDGSTIWKVPTGAGRYADAQGGDGPRCTPTLDGDRLYALGATGKLLCLDPASGEVNWQRDVLDEFDAENLHWGVSSSPLVDGEKLLVNVGAQGASIVAFEKQSGDVRWQALDDVAGYASPIRIDVAGPDGSVVPEVVFFCGKSLIGVSPEDGTLHWRHEFLTTSDMNIATPIYDPATRLLFVSASRDTGRCEAYRLTAKDGGVESELVYRNKEMRNHYNSCVLVDDYLYGFDNSILKCLALETGDLKWEDRSVGKGSLIAVGNHLLVLGEKGDLALVEATPEAYREKGRIKALESDRAWTPPALAGGRLYVRDLENLACVDLTP